MAIPASEEPASMSEKPEEKREVMLEPAGDSVSSLMVAREALLRVGASLTLATLDGVGEEATDSFVPSASV